jgi:hypothetical protein
LMPFLPLQRCTATRVRFSGWMGQSGINMFQNWMPRRAFVVNLKRRLVTVDSRVMIDVLNNLEALEDRYWSDFYSACPPDSESLVFAEYNPKVKGHRDTLQMLDHLQKKRSMLENLRVLHDQTTEFFETRRHCMPHNGGIHPDSPNALFIAMLGAHANKGVEAGHATRALNRAPEKPPPVDCSKGRPTDGWAEMYHQVWKYVEFLPQLVDEIIDKRGCKLTRLEVEEAWWVLVQRGIAWGMSVHVHSPPEMVPSSFYGNQTKVWLA